MRSAFVPVLLSIFSVAACAADVVSTPSAVVVERADFFRSTAFELEPLADSETEGPSAKLAGASSTGFRLRCTSAEPAPEDGTCPEVVVTLPAPATDCFQVEAASPSSALDGAGGAREARTVSSWLPFERASAGRIRVRVPVDARVPLIDVRVVAGAPVRRDGPEWALQADPQDAATLGGRIPVFLTHGFDSGVSLLPFDPARNTDFEAFRALPEYRRSFGAFKYYYFSYRPWADYRTVGAGMAEEIKKVLATEAPPGAQYVVIGRSGGALPARYAVADPELTPRLLGLVTLCGAMRGSVGAALLHANGRVAQRIGIPSYLMLRMTQRTYPFSPMLDSLTFDNFDGSIDPASVFSMGLMENAPLRRFNAAPVDADKLVAYMGEVKNLWGWGDYKVKDELYRRILAAFHPTWGTADPLVHLESGTLAGHTPHLTRLMPGRHHSEVLSDPVLMREILLDLYQFGRTRRFEALWPRLLAAPGL